MKGSWSSTTKTRFSMESSSMTRNMVKDSNSIFNKTSFMLDFSVEEKKMESSLSSEITRPMWGNSRGGFITGLECSPQIFQFIGDFLKKA
jgi:hypothetical protein